MTPCDQPNLPRHADPTTGITSNGGDWRWPAYQQRIHGRTDLERAAAPALPVAPPLLPGLGSACFIEWRYWSVLSEVFHGIVGLSLVNPEQRFIGIAEAGLLLIIAGVFDRPAHPGPGSQSLFKPPPAELCWMHLSPVAACNFDQPRPGWLRAGDAHCRIELDQHSASEADLRIDAAGGLRLRLSHRGLPKTAVEPVLGGDLDRGLAGLVGSHWLVHCPSPVAASDGEIQIDPNALTALAEAGGLRLQVDNRVLHRIRLLRPHRLAVHHFFISEEIGVADWTLRDARGHVIAEAVHHPCGGEVAHFRLQS